MSQNHILSQIEEKKILKQKKLHDYRFFLLYSNFANFLWISLFLRLMYFVFLLGIV